MSIISSHLVNCSTLLSSQCHEKKSPSFNIKSSLPKDVLLDRIRGTIYGNCIGDAIGLLTEFMLKEEAQQVRRYLIFDQ